MKKTFVIFLFLLFSQIVFAALLPVTPDCKIEAVILESKKDIVSYSDPDLKDETKYFLKLEITNIGEMIGQGSTQEQTCQNSFNIGQAVEVVVFKERDLKNQSDELREGQIISLRIQGVQDEFSAKPWFQTRGDANITIVKDSETKNNNAFFFAIIIFVAIAAVIIYVLHKKTKLSKQKYL